MPVGFDNLKKLIKFSLDLAEQIAESTKEKWQWVNAVAFFDELVQIPGVVKSWPNIVAELKDLTKEERQELYDYAVDEFDIENDVVESFVEDALLQAISLISLVEKFKTLKEKKANP